MGTRSRARDHQEVASESVEFKIAKAKLPKLSIRRVKLLKHTVCVARVIPKFDGTVLRVQG